MNGFIALITSWNSFFLNLSFVARVFGLLCAGFSLVAQSGGYSLIVVHGLLIVVASLAVEHGLYMHVGM